MTFLKAKDLLIEGAQLRDFIFVGPNCEENDLSGICMYVSIYDKYRQKWFEGIYRLLYLKWLLRLLGQVSISL